MSKIGRNRSGLRQHYGSNILCGMDFALRGDDPFTWFGDSECFCALVRDAVGADAEILGHIWGRDLSVGEFLNLKGGIRGEGGVFD